MWLLFFVTIDTIKIIKLPTYASMHFSPYILDIMLF